MKRGTRRLLYHLELVGRLCEPRQSSWERLEREIGPVTMRKLLATGGGSSADGSAGRRRHVA